MWSRLHRSTLTSTSHNDGLWGTERSFVLWGSFTTLHYVSSAWCPSPANSHTHVVWNQKQLTCLCVLNRTQLHPKKTTNCSENTKTHCRSRCELGRTQHYLCFASIKHSIHYITSRTTHICSYHTLHGGVHGKLSWVASIPKFPWSGGHLRGVCQTRRELRLTFQQIIFFRQQQTP